MANARRQFLMAVAVQLTLMGCSSHKSRKTAERVPTESMDHGKDQDGERHQTNRDLQLLLEEPVIDEPKEAAIRSALPTFELSTAESLAADGTKFSLIVSEADKLVWLRQTGGFANHINELRGPWPIDSPPCQRLLQSAHGPIQGSGVWTEATGPTPTSHVDASHVDSAEQPVAP